MNPRPEQLEAAIAALDAQRTLLGDAVVDLAQQPLRYELAALRAQVQAQSPGPASVQVSPQQVRPAAATVPTPQLKQVTVLFVDVVGSTAIGQQLTPEDISAVMDGALERFSAIVQAHHGRVLQYTGDGMLAAFGAEAAHEDDVEAAVLAGLAILDDARAQAPRMKREHGVPDFNVRAGIHTGRVLLGAGVDAEGSIRGATVNVAARMEQSAPPGRLRISHDSYRHVRGLFDVEEPAPISVKGVAQPLRSVLVERAKPRAFRVPTRGIDGVATRMVGRDAELALLRHAYDEVCAGAARRATDGQACAGQALRAVTIVGDAGLGKSRLVSEFQQLLEAHAQRCWLLLGRAQPRSALHPYGLLRDLLAWQMHIDDSDSAEAARTKLLQGLAPLFGAEGEAPVHQLGQLIGLDFSTSPHVQPLLDDEVRLRQHGFDAAALALRRMSAARGWPVVVLLDDLHWADAGSLDFARHLLRHNRDTPLLCVMLTRPTLFEQHPDWTEGDPLHARLDLHPLDAAASRELAALLLQRMTSVPAALREIVTGGAEGNPFYMEELVKMLIDDGVIVVAADGWCVLPDKLRLAQVPPTLAGVLQARLDALAPAERSALQAAAIVGHVFRDQALAAVDTAAPQALPALLRKQLVVRRGGAALAGAPQEYAFAHHLLQQVSYDSVLKEPRRLGHARAGAYWSRRAEVARALDVDPATCRALIEAHDHRCRADAADVPGYLVWFDAQFTHYLSAYQGQMLRPLAASVVELCERHFGPDHVETARALTNVARVGLFQRDTSSAEPALLRALAIQERALGADHPGTARTVAVLGGLFQGRGDLRGAEPYFRRALQIRERALGPEHPLTLGTLDNLANVVTELGQLDEALALSQRVLAVRERTLGPDDPASASALTSLAEVLAKRGDPAAAEPLLRRALTLQQRVLPRQHPDTGLTQWHLAEALRALGRHDEAEPLLRLTLEVWEAALGAEHEWTAWALISLAELCLARGDAVQAASCAERSLRIYEQVFGRDHAQVGATLCVLARALRAQGDAAAAEPLLVRAQAIQAARLAPDDAARRLTARLLDETRWQLAAPAATAH